MHLNIFVAAKSFYIPSLRRFFLLLLFESFFRVGLLFSPFFVITIFCYFSIDIRSEYKLQNELSGKVENDEKLVQFLWRVVVLGNCIIYNDFVVMYYEKEPSGVVKRGKAMVMVDDQASVSGSQILLQCT